MGESADLESALGELADGLIEFMQHHCGDPEIGADIAQDALFSGMRALPGLRDPEALKGWVYRIAINRYNDHLRSKARREESERSLRLRRLGKVEDPRALAMAGELDAFLRREMGLLPDRQRSVLMLHGVQGLGQAEIARLLDITVSAVKMSLFHGREKLRKAVRSYHEQRAKPGGGELR